MKKCGVTSLPRGTRGAECGLNTGAPISASAGAQGVFPSSPVSLEQHGNPLEYLSASRLKSFLTCRLKFYYEKVLGLKTPTSPNLHIGKCVHAALEGFHQSVWRGDRPTPDEVLNGYQAAYTQQEEDEPVDYGEKNRDDCFATGERVVKAYLESPLALDPRRILGVEVYLRSEDARLPLPLVGVLDLVREGNAAIDFKTVGATPDLEEEAWANQLQMTVYHLLMQDATGELPDPGELVYLVKTKTPKIIQHRLPHVNSTQINRLARLAEVYVDGVQREDWYPSPGMQCRWCEFRSRCRAWNGNRLAA